eukprot:1904176-Amphidinium_carterae.2
MQWTAFDSGRRVFDADRGTNTLADVTNLAVTAGEYHSPGAKPFSDFSRAHMAWMALQYYQKKGHETMKELWLSLCVCVFHLQLFVAQ